MSDHTLSRLSAEKVDLFNHAFDQVTNQMQAQISDAYNRLSFILDTSYDIVSTYHLRDISRISGRGRLEYYDEPLYYRRVSYPTTRGGMTIVVIQNHETGKYHIGVAHCSSSDCYNKRRGRTIATKRAYDAMQKGVVYGLPHINSKREMSAIMRTVYANVDPKYMVDSYTFVHTGEKL